MSSYLERVQLDQSFAGAGENTLDRIKRLREEGWEVTVLIEYKPNVNGRGVTGTGYVLVLGWKP